MIKQNQKLTPKEFTLFLYPFAKKSEEKTGISALSILAQAALESGWNSASPGWMFFGEKDFDGINGDEQLLPTFEYNKSATLSAKQIGLNNIDRIEPVVLNGKKYFKYSGKAYFKKFNSPEDCFTRHGEFFKINKRYSEALKVKEDPYKFIEEISKAGYAQSPTYSDTLKTIVRMIEKVCISEKLISDKK